MKIKAAAKINLGLDILGRREDGYHEVRMIMQSLKLHDELNVEVWLKGSGVSFASDAPYLPKDETNLAVKAARLLQEEFSLPGEIRIQLKKNIPVAAGLAGGSTDGAAVLRAVNSLYRLGLDEEALMKRGLKIGADVPFCLQRKTALSEGIGEKLRPLPSMPTCCLLLAKPSFGASTGKIYEGYDALQEVWHPDIDALIGCLEEGSLEKLAEGMGNVLENVTGALYPQIGCLKEMMIREGALNAMMSGSGPTVFGIFRQKKEAQKAAGRLHKSFPDVRLILTEPLER